MCTKPQQGTVKKEVGFQFQTFVFLTWYGLLSPLQMNKRKADCKLLEGIAQNKEFLEGILRKQTPQLCELTPQSCFALIH